MNQIAREYKQAIISVLHRWEMKPHNYLHCLDGQATEHRRKAAPAIVQPAGADAVSRK